MGEQEVDPYDPEPPYIYECVACGVRVEDDHQPEACPECAAQMEDLAVPRE